MTAPEQRQARAPRAASGGTADAVTLTMGHVEADLFSVFLAAAYKARRAQLEENHEAELRDAELRTLRNVVYRIRRELPEDEFPKLDLS